MSGYAHARLHNLVLILLFLPWNSLQEQQSNKKSVVPNSAPLSEDEVITSQNRASATAATISRQNLAKLSSDWADVAIKYTLLKTKEVVELTRQAQEAQIASLRFGSIASRLNSAVMSAQEVFDMAFERYKSLSALARAAENHSSETSKALYLLQYVQSIREKWATEERARALRLSQHLQNILYDLKQATEHARTAKDYADMSEGYIVYK